MLCLNVTEFEWSAMLHLFSDRRGPRSSSYAKLIPLRSSEQQHIQELSENLRTSPMSACTVAKLAKKPVVFEASRRQRPVDDDIGVLPPNMEMCDRTPKNLA